MTEDQNRPEEEGGPEDAVSKEDLLKDAVEKLAARVEEEKLGRIFVTFDSYRPIPQFEPEPLEIMPIEYPNYNEEVRPGDIFKTYIRPKILDGSLNRIIGMCQAKGWRSVLDERQRGLVANCELYATHNPSGLPGHNLMTLVADLAHLLTLYYSYVLVEEQRMISRYEGPPIFFDHRDKEKGTGDGD